MAGARILCPQHRAPLRAVLRHEYGCPADAACDCSPERDLVCSAGGEAVPDWVLEAPARIPKAQAAPRPLQRPRKAPARRGGPLGSGGMVQAAPGLGTELREARIGAGLSQSAMAERLEVTQQTVTNWETGRTKPKEKQVAAWFLAASKPCARAL